MILKKFKYKCVNSTNDVAIGLIKKNIKSGIVISKMQKKGRGRYVINSGSAPYTTFLPNFSPISSPI